MKPDGLHGTESISADSDPSPAFHSVPTQALSALQPRSFFKSYQKPGRPVVMTNALRHQWSLDYLREQIGDRIFLIRQFGRERYQQDKRQWSNIGSGVESASMTFSDYADIIQDGSAQAEDLYLAKFPITHTPLAKAAYLQNLVDQLPMRLPVTDWNLWVGPGGHTTCLHYDPFDGVLVQLCGTKRVVLFPPSQLYNLYPFPVINHLKYGAKLRSGYSQIYPDAIDYDSFPNARKAQAKRYEVILKPGESLFIPAGWWHEVSTLGDGMVCSVNRFWNVYPLFRALRLWSKWRVHFASMLAAPYVVQSLVKAIASPDQSLKLGQLFQRL